MNGLPQKKMMSNQVVLSSPRGKNANVVMKDVN